MVSSMVTMFAVVFSVLVPQKMWYPPSQPLTVSIRGDKDATLELSDFAGNAQAAQGSADVAAGKSVDLKTIFPHVADPGTYLLYAVPKGTAATKSGAPKDFLGTPLVIEVTADQQQPQVAMITHVIPLQYAEITTEAGTIKAMFYYDSAPHTVDNFLQLAAGGFYDGLVFHRIIPTFMIQGGDPLGSEGPPRMGTGGPGYQLPAEFNDRPHLEGVLSMARAQDPNSAGSQFFICLDYSNTHQLDHQYTAFGRVVSGMDAVKKIAGAKTDASNNRPEQPQVITKVEVKPVTASDNPYADFLAGGGK
jgi:peptidyl-prolyl cis-trans isomerase B (cyclophilin B)